MPHRDFELAPTNADPPTFSVAGREFKCLPEAPSGVLLDLVSVIGQDVGHQARGLIAYISGCLPDEEADAFTLLIHDKDTIVPLATLGEIAEWLAEVYAGRPTTPSSGSAVGSPSTPAMSEDGSLSPASSSSTGI